MTQNGSLDVKLHTTTQLCDRKKKIEFGLWAPRSSKIKDND